MGMLLWLPAWCDTTARTVNQCDNLHKAVTPLPRVVHTEGVEIASPPMNTQIAECPTYAGFFTLTTEKGKTIQVNTRIEGLVTVYIQRNGMTGLPMGRNFPNLGAAVQGYKAKDVKAALYALAER